MIKQVHSNIFTLLFLLTIFNGFSVFAQDQEDNYDRWIEAPWTHLTTITSSIPNTVFGDNSFNVTDFGAIGDAKTDNSDAIRDAIVACNKSGGGKVIIPKGQFLTGPIYLKSNVNLHLKKGAEVLFKTDPDEFPIVHTSYEGLEVMNYSPLVYAYNEENIAITGNGTLNGQADNTNWWPWCGAKRYGWKEGQPNQNDPENRPALAEMAEQNIPVEERIYGNGKYLRPTFIEPFQCDRVLIQGITIINAPFWVIHPMKSTNIIVDGVTVNSHGPNNDGCDPEYSKNVWVKNCVFDTGDDCIAIKSGRNADGRRVGIVSENIVVEGCQMKDGHGGVVMGSEISAGVRNVFVQNCKMSSPNLDRAIRVKTNTKRGGFIEHVYVRNVEVGEVREALLKLNMYYATYSDQTGDYMPVIRYIHLENIAAENGGKYGIRAEGYEESPIQHIRMKNVVINNVEQRLLLKYVSDLKFENTVFDGQIMESIDNIH